MFSLCICAFSFWLSNVIIVLLIILQLLLFSAVTVCLVAAVPEMTMHVSLARLFMAL